MTRLIDLLPGLVDARIVGDPDIQIADLQYDSRAVLPGTLFVAVRGGYVDGHDYVPKAIASGAAAVVVEQELDATIPQLVVTDSRRDLATIAAAFYGKPSQELSQVVGITGTDGKTTTSYILDHILRTLGSVTGMIGTVSVRIADETIDHETRQTTPESADIQRLLRQMVGARVDTAILEATSHGLDLHRLDHVRFSVGVVTNITHEHLEHHKTVENYWRAKGILFERVASEGGAAVVNLDDAGARSVLVFCNGCRSVVTYSTSDSAADLIATIARSDLNGSIGTVTWRDQTLPLRVPLVGEFNVSNALAAIGAALSMGEQFANVIEAVASTPHVPGRMTAIDQGQPFGVIVDYAHTPESLEKVLRLLRQLRSGGRLIVVFGSGGERDTTKRPIQGRVAIECADIAIITNEDPRFERAEVIVDEIAAGAIAAGGNDGSTVFRIVERREALSKAFEIAREGDTILLAGKGHERSIIWNGVKLPWDEESVARELLAERGWAGS